MNNLKLFLYLILLLSLSACTNPKVDKGRDGSAQQVSTDLQVDHFNIWVDDPQRAKQRLIDLGFTAVPDSLSAVHHGQGTAGRYFNFLNTYLELIFVYDQNELAQNVQQNNELDFIERANFAQNGASPLSIALKVKDYAEEKIPFATIPYHQNWMEKDANIYAAKNSKTHLKEPSIFVVYPKIEAEQFTNLAELQRIPEEYAFYRATYQHPNGAERVTKIILTTTATHLNTPTLQALNDIQMLTVQSGSKHLMELYFDDNRQGKSVDLRPELPLKVNW